jgi:tetratricopeptide (TPR) repeat protein
MIARCCTAALVAGTALPLALGAQQAGVDSAVQLYRAHRYAEARAVLGPASTGGDVRAYYWLGRIAAAQNDADAATRWLEKAVHTNDTSSEYHLWLGRVYGIRAEHASLFKRAGLAKRTKAEFERAVALDPRNIDARADLVTYYLVAPGFLGGSHEKAKAMADAIRKLDPYRGGLVAATIAEDEKNDAGAEREYRRLMESYPDSATPVALMITRDQRARRWDDAFSLAEHFLARHPADPAVLYQLGKSAALSGQHLDTGEAALRSYLSIPVGEGLPPYEGAHLRLGMIEERKGNTAAAKTEYEAALALDPTLEEARKALGRLR